MHMDTLKNDAIVEKVIIGVWYCTLQLLYNY